MAAVTQRASIRSRLQRVPASLYVVLGVALALRVAWVAYAAREPPTFGDPFIYLQLARRVASGHGYGPLFSPGPTAFHPPGYPGWLAGVVWIATHVGLSHHEPLLAGLLQAAIGTASVALVYAITARLFGPRVALIAAVITAGFPNLIFYSALLYSETLYTFGALLAVWIIVRAEWKPAPSLRVLAAFGLVVGLSSLVRPFSMLSLLAVGYALWRAGVSWRDTARNVGIAAGIAVLVLVPWTIRNAFAFHAFIPVSTNLGDTVCLDNSPGAYGGFRDLPPQCTLNPGYSPNVGGPSIGMYEPKENSNNLHYAVKWAIHHPSSEVTLVFRRAFYGYRDDHDGLTDATGPHGNFPPPRLRNPLSRVADFYYYFVLVLALGACLRFRRDPRRIFVLLVAASLAAVPLFLYGLVRFHIPLLPFLAIGAAVSIDALERARNPISRRAGGTA